MLVFQRLFLFAGFVSMLGLCAQEQTKSDDVLVRALSDEMQRSLVELQVDDEPKPYFIAYAVNESSQMTVRSILGATTRNDRNIDRNLYVALRVGSRELDNTNFVSSSTNPWGSTGVPLPLSDSYNELRRTAWMVTDSAYKAAVGLLSAKKATLAQQPALDRTDDFNVEEPFEYVSDVPAPSVDNDKLVEFSNSISALMKSHPAIQHAFTIVSYEQNKQTYLDSDGNFHRVHSSLCLLRSHATVQASDGAMVHDFVVARARSCSEFFNDLDGLKAQHEAMVASLLEFRNAEQIRSYTGPVLLTETASASFFAQVIASRAGATPRAIVETGANDLLGFLRNPFLDKIGARVFPRFLSVTNDPTISEFGGTSLLGSYVADSEGVRSRRTELVRDGELLTLLTTRNPVPEINTSSGSNRSGSALPGNIFVTSSESVSEEELKQELLAWVEDSGNEFGIIVKSFQDLETLATVSIGGLRSLTDQLLSGGLVLFPTVRAYRVNLDGSEIPLHTLNPLALSDRQLRDIVAVSDTAHAYNVAQTFSPATFYSSWLSAGLVGLGTMSSSFMGVVSPSVLIEEMELQGGSSSHPRLPIVSHPADQ